MPKGSKDGSVYKRLEKRTVFSGNKKTVKEIWQWYARCRYIGLDGLEHEKKRRANPNNYARACELKREIIAEIEAETAAPVEPVIEHTFTELAEHYKDEYLIAPVYVAGVKVAGLRSHKKLLTPFNVLVAYFADLPLRSITYEALRLYKKERLATPACVCQKHPMGRQRSLAGVQRELQLLRAMLNVALRTKKWISENPFYAGKPLINADDETKRMRILTHDEERRLLAACGERTYTYVWRGRELSARNPAKRRQHLRSIIILSIDTAARHGEEFELRWKDVYLEDGIIVIQSWISKTGQERIVPITDRLKAALRELWDSSDKNEDSRIIQRKGVRSSFANACRAAGIEGYRWHDNRHTGTTRMLEAIRDQTKVMKITGHTNLKTFLRYVNLNAEIAREAGRLMDERRAEITARETVRGEN